jgi:cytochrome c peroxidase
MTAPYFHDGSVATLEQAVTMMARYQLRKVLEPADVMSIRDFLSALTGQLPETLSKAPGPANSGRP